MWPQNREHAKWTIYTSQAFRAHLHAHQKKVNCSLVPSDRKIGPQKKGNVPSLAGIARFARIFTHAHKNIKVKCDRKIVTKTNGNVVAREVRRRQRVTQFHTTHVSKIAFPLMTSPKDTSLTPVEARWNDLSQLTFFPIRDKKSELPACTVWPKKSAPPPKKEKETCPPLLGIAREGSLFFYSACVCVSLHSLLALRSALLNAEVQSGNAEC